METNSKILIAGRGGLIGPAIERKFRKEGFNNIIGLSSEELDLRNQSAVFEYFEREKPEYVILTAAKAGSIMANIKSPAEFLYDNLAIQNNVIEAAYRNGVNKLLFFASSSIYPKNSPQPMKEEYLLDGKLEPTDEGYALAKIVGLKLCEMYNRQYGTNYICVMPSNVYGIGDNFEPEKSHVLPALIRRFHEAKINGVNQVEVWGTGKARRDFIFVDDLADACFYLFTEYNGNDFFNIGIGKDYSIKEIVEIISEVVGYEGEIVFDTSKPDGVLKKLMDAGKINEVGWSAKTGLREGIEKTYKYFLDEVI